MRPGLPAFAVLCALWAPPLEAAPPALTLESSTQKLVVGREDAATLVIRGPADVLADIRVGCSAGTLKAQKRGSPGELRLELLPPRSGEASWLVCGAASLATRASATLTLELQRPEVLSLGGLPPLSRVEVKLGGTLFGPVRANGAGLAQVPVVLSPAFRQAEVISTPPGKAPQSRLQPVSVSWAEQTLLIPTASEALADGQTPVPVFAFTFNRAGERSSEALIATSEEGMVEDLLLAPGTHLLSFLPHPRASPTEALLTARTANGRAALTRLSLQAGVKPVLELRSNVRGLPADGVAAAELTVFVRDESGRGLPFQKPQLTTQVGRVSIPEERAGGLYVARYSAPAGTATQSAVTATLEGAEPATLVLQLIPPPRLTVDTSPREIPADGQSRVVLSIFARDAVGQPLPDGAVLQLSSSLGTVAGAVTTVGGRATTELISGTVAGLAHVDIRSADASASTQVRLLPGAVARVEVQPARETLTCDGNDSVPVRLRVRDAHGNGLDALPVEISEEEGGVTQGRGRFDRVTTLGNGEFAVQYHAPPGCERGTVVLVASSGGVKGTASVRVVRGFSAALGITLRLAGLHNLGRVASGAVELEGDLPVVALGPRFLATLALAAAWSGPFEGTALNRLGATAFVGHLFSASVFLGPRWTLYEDDRAHLYLGGGLDAHHVRARFSHLPGETRSGLALGGHLRLGGGYALGPGLLMSQVRFNLTPLATAEASLAGQRSALSVALGYRLPF